MQPSPAAQLALLFLTLTAIAVLYLLTAWQLGKRKGTSALFGCWVVASLLLPVLVVARDYLQLNAAGADPSFRFLTFNVALLFTLSVLALGAASLGMWHQVKRPAAERSAVRAFVTGFAAYWAGMLVWLVLAVLFIDLERMTFF